MDATRRADLRDKLEIAEDLMSADHQRSDRLVLQMIELSSSARMRFEIFNDLLEELKIYTLNHFAREESFMGLCDYPDTPEHKAAHLQQLQQLSSVSEAVKQCDQAAIKQLMLSMLDDWQTHRGDHDRRLGEFIRAIE